MAVIPKNGKVSPVLVAGAVIGFAVTLVAGLILGALLDRGTAAAAPAEGSVDVGFARDMREHHAQAVQMSTLVRDATENEEVRTLALDILLTQQQQMGQMYAWLEDWGLPQSSATSPMRWMLPGDSDASENGHGSMAMDVTADGMMPGMATDEQLLQLAQAKGTRAERLYLQLMIPHHEAGVRMAQYAADRARQPQVRRLARGIVESQSAEIEVLESMLAARGGRLPES